MGRVDGKCAIVTGAASGIGAAAARALAAEGAAVLIADIAAEGAEAVAAEIAAAGGRAVASVTDVGDPAAVRAMVAQAADAFGGVDILFNNAAALDLRERDLDVADVDLAVWRRQLDVNLTGPLIASQEAIPLMVARGGGSIIHTSSAAALRADITRTGYAATKAGLHGLSRSIAVQYGKQGIRSNVVAPGLVVSPFIEARFTTAQRELYLDCHMTPRTGVPGDVAAAVVFLASDDAAFVTGQELAVDGGFSSMLPVVPPMRRAAGG